MGMIRVSDKVEGRLKEVADGRSMSATVEMLLAKQDLKDSAHGDAKEIIYHIDEVLRARFDELASLIKDTAVDRLDRSFSRPRYETEIDWPIMKELIYDVLGYEDDSWASRAAAEGITESNDLEETRFILSDNFICVDKGKKVPIIKLTPKVKTFLESKGVVQ